ncbi:hypothetical protein [Streptomyces puniciscabiei]|uniref:hypothetical protein n=1 Tax=Streptomyces puniciscabiei TaxID=164348 RepID=UPI003323337E
MHKTRTLVTALPIGGDMVSQALPVVQGREAGMEVAPIQRDVAQGFDDRVRQIACAQEFLVQVLAADAEASWAAPLDTE